MNLLKTGEAPTPAKIDPEALARLRALGYVGGADRVSAPPRPGRGPIPRTGSRCCRSCCRRRPIAMRDGSTRPRGGSRSWCARTPTTPPSSSRCLGLLPPQGRGGAIEAAQTRCRAEPGVRRRRARPRLRVPAAGRPDEAATGFERVLELDPENLKALLNLGEIHARGEREKAFDFYQRAGGRRAALRAGARQPRQRSRSR